MGILDVPLPVTVALRCGYVVGSCAAISYGTRSCSRTSTMGVSLLFAGMWLVAETVRDWVLMSSRVSRLHAFRLQLEALILHYAPSWVTACPSSIGVSSSENAILREVESVGEALSESLEALNVFIPLPAREKHHAQSASPTVHPHEPLVRLVESIDDEAPGTVPFNSFDGASPAAAAEQASNEHHIQLLLNAIRCPDASTVPPPMPSSPAPQSPSRDNDASMALVASPTLMNASSLSSPKRGANRSIVGSPKLSTPAGAIGRRGHPRTGNFRAFDTVADASAFHVGAVMVVHLTLPCRDDALPATEVVEPLSAAIGRCISLIADYGGVVYYFDLTRMIATFHVQRPCVDYALCSVYAGLAVSQVLESLSEDGVSFGVGIALGSMLAGDVGNDQVRACVVHGSVVQEAWDLSNLNFCLQTRVLLSEAVNDQVQNGVVTMLVDFVSTHDVMPGTKLSGVSVASRCKGVFEARGAEIRFDDSTNDDVNFASRLPHESLVAYLEAFYYLRKGQFGTAADRLSVMPPEVLDNDPQMQRILRLAVFYRDRPNPPPSYLRDRYTRWEQLELRCDEDAVIRHASPSYAGRKSTHLSHESPTRIIEAVMRARSCTPATHADTTGAVESLDGSRVSVTQLSLTVSSEFADVSGTLWRKSERVLGKGAFGEVFLGMRVDDGKLVAMKQLRIPEIVSGSAGGTRMRRNQQRERHELNTLVSEIKMLCGLRHPNIVFFLGCGIVNQDIVINLEYVSGGSLQCVLEEFGCIPTPAAQRYLKDVLRGLDFLHGKGIIHRDVKPGNVLLHVDGGCKVTDFGTSIQIQNILDNNIVVGTPIFMSPEQARGSTTTCLQSDLWSVGIMTIQLLTGALPIQINGPIEAHQYMHRLATDDAFEVPIPDTLTAVAASFASQCLRRDPMQRGTAQELLLHPFLFSASTPSHPTPLRQKSSTAFSPSPPGSANSQSPLQPYNSK